MNRKTKFANQSCQFNKSYFHSHRYRHVSFSRFSQYWWANRYYANIINKIVPQNSRILEIGCGMGDLLHRLDTNFQTYGIDINKWALAQTKKKTPNSTIKFISAANLSDFPAGHFNAVIAKHVLEHLPRPRQVIIDITRILTPGGWFIFSVPNLDSLMRPIKGQNWVGYQDPTHISLLSTAEWKNFIRAAGLKILKTWSDGFWDPPYLPLIPNFIQRIFFGAPGGLQAIFGWKILPVKLGETLIILSQKPQNTI